MFNAINWFEIPAQNFDRAVTFYNTILDVTLHREVFGGVPNGILPYERGNGVGGAVVSSDDYQPGRGGVVVYLNADGKLDAVLSRVEAAGGNIVMPKTSMEGVGDFAWISDTEGNTVGLHQSA